MYSHMFKGFTVGSELTRRVLRTIIGIPGLILDCFVAVLYPNGFSAYWEECRILYDDNDYASPCQFFFLGVVGDFLGCAYSYIC